MFKFNLKQQLPQKRIFAARGDLDSSSHFRVSTGVTSYIPFLHYDVLDHQSHQIQVQVAPPGGQISHLSDVFQKKTGKCGNFSQVGDPPCLSLGTPCL